MLAKLNKDRQTLLSLILETSLLNKISLTMCQTQVNKWAEEYKRFFGIISIANQIFDYAISMELIDSNPMRKTLKPKRTKKDKEELEQFYNKEELKTFFEMVQELDDIENAHFLPFIGFHRNEEERK